MESDRAKHEAKTPVYNQAEALKQDDIPDSSTPDNPYDLCSSNYKDFKSATTDIQQYLSYRQIGENKNNSQSRGSPPMDEPYSKNIKINNFTTISNQRGEALSRGNSKKIADKKNNSSKNLVDKKKAQKKQHLSLNSSIDTKLVSQSKTNLMSKDNSTVSLNKIVEKSSLLLAKKKGSIDLAGDQLYLNCSGHGSGSRAQVLSSNLGNLTQRKPNCSN